MSEQNEFDFEQGDSRTAELLTGLMNRAERILVKKLSNNDRDWAKCTNKHQGGVYISAEQRDGGFFPPLAVKERDDPRGADIREAWFSTLWPQAKVGDREKRSRIVHYTSKGPETHVTRLPKDPFAWLSPASFMVMGRLKGDGEPVYECLTVNSAAEEADFLADLFEIGPDFLVGEFEPSALKAKEHERVLDFVEQLIGAWMAGTISSFAREHAVMPPTEALARMAREAFLKQNSMEQLNPFEMECPGNALREISRSIEWDLFREFQRRERSVELVRIVLGDEPGSIEPPDVIRKLVDELPAIDALMLSAAQQRKSRAGYSYEHHIEAMLIGGNIPFEKQVVIEARKRPDFILPSQIFVDSGKPEASSGLILSAKTTLRERWKQVEREKGSRNLYLTTVDENIAGNAIKDMASIGVKLVIPESLMETKETEYEGHDNVLTFRKFCAEIVKPSMKYWH
ncbi:type II restriction endonuclease [Labrenzia sp. 011]|uniref:type II restriction endonuclease n=1 Tax=Labrenzia sp. 011 TaxID=2171494 RepID=UPI001402D5CD|nr:type II restriction endonuclease [Labrenzia sp. 011]